MSSGHAGRNGGFGMRSLDPLNSLMERPLPDGAAELLHQYIARVGSRQAVYLSTPITTGLRYLEWLRNHRDSSASDETYARQLKAEVIAENIRQVRPLRARMQVAYPEAYVIDPTEVDNVGWSQFDYHRFWVEVVRKLPRRVAFADGWQYSTGCALEFAACSEAGLMLLDSDLLPLSNARAVDLLAQAISELVAAGVSAEAATFALQLVRDKKSPTDVEDGSLRKDDRLFFLSRSYNVAVFASFGPGEPDLRRLVSPNADQTVQSLAAAVRAVFEGSRSGTVNVRTFRDGYSKSTPFHYGLGSVDEACALVRRAAAQGYYTIVNETIDVHDGGVSGVSLGGRVEFSPDDTPRAVEKPGSASLAMVAASELLRIVYGLPLELPGSISKRYEFSVHPRRVGYRQSHLCLWEAEEVAPIELDGTPSWPNRFSRLIGDKTYGLLMAHLAGVLVPETTVISRRIAPFRFGTPTGTGERWLRTAPAEQDPGTFTTSPSWIDPFKLLAREDPAGTRLAAGLSQESVPAVFSGATIPRESGGDLIEAVPGTGINFMLGAEAGVELPEHVKSAVRDVLGRLREYFNTVRIEWAFDGVDVWVLQLHKVRQGLPEGVVSPGEASEWMQFDPRDGLEALHELVEVVQLSRAGVLLTSAVGVTSHVGDILRRAGVPSKFVASNDQRLPR